MKQWDVIVVGGGHAGIEAAAAASRMGVAVALVTMRQSDIGVMSCNPAFGGLGKGHLVREIDALDGVMADAADRAGIQFRLLNRRKGPAVQGPRAQADRSLFREAVVAAVARLAHCETVFGEVVDLLMQGDSVAGVVLADGSSLRSRAVVLTTGTFLGGVIHIGPSKSVGGRLGDGATHRLSRRLRDYGLPVGRLKTGTPPRLKGRTIDWESLEQQPGDDYPVLFSFRNKRPFVRQVACAITHTNQRTHDIIRANLEQSAMYGGHISGVGPRYCPSIEDKVVRFADKGSHQVFLEPEGLDVDVVYPNGISTSLPKEIQTEYVRSIRGLEQAEILQPGYAIEYDYVDPRALTRSLGLRACPGLFLAGQINGTTGYEEAGAQGLISGLNAARFARDEEPVSLSRDQSYIGVMIDDLVTRGVSEPYRMFTSRAEFRLQLRADNADQRLTPLGMTLGCIQSDRARMFCEKMERLEAARTALSETVVSAKALSEAGIRINPSSQPRSILDALSLPGAATDLLHMLNLDVPTVAPESLVQIVIDQQYAPYIERQERDVATLKAEERRRIPPDFDYRSLSGLSHELTEKLEAIRPESLAQAGRVDGVTPAALGLILAHLERQARQAG